MIYGRKFLCEQQESPVENFDITLEVSSKDTKLLNMIYDYYLEQADEEPVTEGANAEYTDAIKKYAKSYKENIKEARKLYKDGDYTKAKASYSKAEKDAKDMEKEIKAVKSDDVLTAILGFFINGGVNYIISFGSGIAIFIPLVGHAAYIQAMIQSIEETKTFIKELKTTGINSKSLNLYRNKLLAFTKNIADIAKLGQDACDAKKKGK